MLTLKKGLIIHVAGTPIMLEADARGSDRSGAGIALLSQLSGGKIVEDGAPAEVKVPGDVAPMSVNAEAKRGYVPEQHGNKQWDQLTARKRFQLSRLTVSKCKESKRDFKDEYARMDEPGWNDPEAVIPAEWPGVSWGAAWARGFAGG